MLHYSSAKLKIQRLNERDQKIEVAIGSGFFWAADQIFYLITNWHNVTGWDPVKNESLSSTGAVPTHLEMPLLFKPAADADQKMLQRKRFTIPLYDNDDVPRWYEHPSFGNTVDVVAIEIASVDEAIISQPINMLNDLVDFEPELGDEVFVLGYPGGLDGGPVMAIWKRGSIASHPSVDLDGLPKLLVDTATRKGMSGAPVIARRRGVIVPRGTPKTPGALSGQEIIGQADTFLGVYSGRIGDDELGVQLGIVWKAAVLDEIIAAKKTGTSPY